MAGSRINLCPVVAAGAIGYGIISRSVEFLWSVGEGALKKILVAIEGNLVKYANDFTQK
jgi:hypothetical protein